MSHKEKPLPVIIRYEGKGDPHKVDWHLSDLIAIFPTLPGDNRSSSMQCYSSVGQHSSCDSGYSGLRTKPAHGGMVRAMLAELRSVGYKNLKVIKRPSSHHRAERVRAIQGDLV